MSKKIEDLVGQMVTEENDWRGHVKKHLAAHPKKSLGKMGDEETKEFFKKVKSSHKKGHSDEEIKKMHNGGEESEEKKEESHRMGIALMILEQIMNLNVRHDVMYESEIKELRSDLLHYGYTEELAKIIMNNKIFLGEIADPSKIKVENPGVLEVPEGKDIAKLPFSHFKNLAEKKGSGTVVKALMNLYRWNKGKGGEKGNLASWAKGTQEKLSAATAKAE